MSTIRIQFNFVAEIFEQQKFGPGDQSFRKIGSSGPNFLKIVVHAQKNKVAFTQARLFFAVWFVEFYVKVYVKYEKTMRLTRNYLSK